MINEVILNNGEIAQIEVDLLDFQHAQEQQTPFFATVEIIGSYGGRTIQTLEYMSNGKCITPSHGASYDIIEVIC